MQKALAQLDLEELERKLYYYPALGNKQASERGMLKMKKIVTRRHRLIALLRLHVVKCGSSPRPSRVLVALKRPSSGWHCTISGWMGFRAVMINTASLR